jgi:hypothetical protein
VPRIPRPLTGTAPAIPHPQGWPSAIDREALRLVRELTPAQRHLLVRAGLPRWMRLAAPWYPSSGQEAAEARRLASRAFGILEPLPRERGAYQLTPLGELVAGMAIINVLTLS